MGRPASVEHSAAYIQAALDASILLAPYDIKATAEDNKLVLTGTVPNKILAIMAGDIVRECNENCVVVNNIVINPEVNGKTAGERSLSNILLDVEVSFAVRTAINDNNIIIVGLEVKTVNAVVELSGRVPVGSEKDRLLSVVERAKGVEKVRDNVVVDKTVLAELGITLDDVYKNARSFRGEYRRSSWLPRIRIDLPEAEIEFTIEEDHKRHKVEATIGYDFVSRDVESYFRYIMKGRLFFHHVSAYDKMAFNPRFNKKAKWERRSGAGLMTEIIWSRYFRTYHGFNADWLSFSDRISSSNHYFSLAFHFGQGGYQRSKLLLGEVQSSGRIYFRGDLPRNALDRHYIILGSHGVKWFDGDYEYLRTETELEYEYEVFGDHRILLRGFIGFSDGIDEPPDYFLYTLGSRESLRGRKGGKLQKALAVGTMDYFWPLTGEFDARMGRLTWNRFWLMGYLGSAQTGDDLQILKHASGFVGDAGFGIGARVKWKDHPFNVTAFVARQWTGVTSPVFYGSVHTAY